MLDWTGLQYGAETLGSGLHPGPTEDKIGPFPWQEGQRRDIGKLGGEPSLLHIINKPHLRATSSSAGGRKFLSSGYRKRPAYASNTPTELRTPETLLLLPPLLTKGAFLNPIVIVALLFFNYTTRVPLKKL